MTEQDLHNEAINWMDNMNIKYGWNDIASLNEFLYEHTHELLQVDLSNGQRILNKFY